MFYISKKDIFLSDNVWIKTQYPLHLLVRIFVIKIKRLL